MAIDETLWTRIRNNDPVITPELLFQRADITANDLKLIGLAFQKGLNNIISNREKARQWYEKAIEKGCAEASSHLGFLYEHGHGVSSGLITNLTAIFYAYDYGVPQNITAAAQCYQKAIDKGYIEAQKYLDQLLAKDDLTANQLNLIGVMYTNADQVIRNDNKALACFTRAIAKGHTGAKRNLGFMNEFGRGVQKNFVAAAKHYQIALEKGYKSAEKDIERILNSTDISASSSHDIALMYYKGHSEGVSKNFEKTRLWYEKAFSKGLSYAGRNLGLLYENGQGVSKNLVKAAQCYRQSIEKGFADGQKDIERLFAMTVISANELEQIGLMYIHGDGVTTNYECGLVWLTKAQEKGSPSACRHIGKLYELGHGVPANAVMAVKFYFRAKSKGDEQVSVVLERLTLTSEQWSGLGEDYYDGKNNVTKDLILAKSCFENALSTNPNHSRSHYVLGWMYEHGQGELTIDLGKAQYHYEQSILAGYFPPQNRLLLMDNPTLTTAEKWYNLGMQYHGGKNGQIPDDLKARACFELALKKEPNHKSTRHYLALLLQYGLGIEKNTEKAREQFKKLASEEHSPSQLQLSIIEDPLLSAVHNQDHQLHFLRIQRMIQSIQESFPWVKSHDLMLTITRDNLAEIAIEFKVYIQEFRELSAQYRQCLDDRERSSTEDNQMALSLNTLDAAQNVYKCLMKYEFQLQQRAPSLLNDKTLPIDDEINTIRKCLAEYETLLNQLVSLEPLGLTQFNNHQLSFFSFVKYIEHYSTQERSLSL